MENAKYFRMALENSQWNYNYAYIMFNAHTFIIK